MDEAESVLGSVVVSGSRTSHITGFAGPTPLLVALDPDGRVRGVLLRENSEDEGYLQDVIDSGLLGQWDGLTPEQAVLRQVDAVSGATMSSSSIIETLRGTLRPLAGEERAASPEPVFWGRVAAVWVVLLLDLALFLAPKRLRRLRPWLAAANAGVLGFWAGRMLSLAQACGWCMHGMPVRAWATTAAMAVLAVLLPLLTGRDFYCSHVCPYGACQVLLGRLRRTQARVPHWLGSGLRTLRGAVLGVAWLGLAAGSAVDVGGAEPFGAFQVRAASAGVLVLAAAFLLVSVFVPRGWCRYLCPTGRLLATARCAPALAEERRGALVDLRTLCLLLLIAAGGWLAWTASYLPPEQPEHVLDAIQNRRSVRHYADRPVSAEQLDVLLRAGMAAPTAGDRRPWAFVVVTEPKRLKELASGLEYGDALGRAAAAIVVCGLPEQALPGEANGMWVLDCAAASENILLAAHGLGLGGVWVGVYPIRGRIEAVRRVLGLPEGAVPLNAISLGHPARKGSPKRKYDASRLHWESWGGPASR